MSPQAPSQVDVLRSKVTTEQRALLTVIWTYFRDHQQWPAVRQLHKDRGGKEGVRLALENLGGGIVRDEPEAGRRGQYQLTLLGVLLTENGEAYEQLLVRFLDYTVSVDPSRTEVYAQDVSAALKLDSEQTGLLGALIKLDDFLWNWTDHSSNLGTDHWTIGIGDDVEDIPVDRRAYIHERATKWYFPDVPLSRIEREHYFANKQAEVIRRGGQRAVLSKLVEAIDKARSADEKGKSLEDLVCQLFMTIPGFSVSDRGDRVRTATEEIDVVVTNNSDDPRFKREGAIILVECKNWSGKKKCGKNELGAFQRKVENRNDRCSLGFFVSWNGFAVTFEREQLRGSRERILIVPLTGTDIRAAVANNSFHELIVRAWERAVML